MEDKALWMLEVEVEFLQSKFNDLTKKLKTEINDELIDETHNVMMLLIHTKELLYRYLTLTGVSQEEIIKRLEDLKNNPEKTIKWRDIRRTE